MTSSVLALLPKEGMGDVPSALHDAFLKRLDSQLLWMVHPAAASAPAALSWWEQELKKLPALQSVKGRMGSADQQSWGKFYFEHRNGLLDVQTRERLQNGSQATWILGQLYSAFAGVSSKELEFDPLLLVRGAQLSQQQNAGQLRLEDGWLVSQDAAGRRWYMLRGELKYSSYDVEQAHAVVTQLDNLKAEFKRRWPGSEVLSRGAVFYSDYASQRAKADISTFGTATVLGVFLFILGVFRSFLPLLLCVCSVGVGALAGITVTLLVFGELHLLTLAMSISIIGISVDYALYYLAERMVHGEQTAPLATLKKILPALSLALGTTVIAYLLIIIAPFPGLRQLAMLASTGLSAACLTVVMFYPYLVARLPVRRVPAGHLLGTWLQAWYRHRLIYLGLPLLLAGWAIAGVMQLQVDDDIAQLQDQPEVLRQQEQQIAALTGQRLDQKWFVVHGPSAEETLRRAERLQPELSTAQQAGWLAGFRLLTLSSLQQQQQDLKLLQETSPGILQQLAQLGIDVAKPDLRPMPVRPDEWVNSIVSEGSRLLWLSLPDGQSAVLVPVSGVMNSPALQAIAQKIPGVAWVDRKGNYDRLFSGYRILLGWILLAAVTLVTLSYMLRLGFWRGMMSVIPSVVSIGCGLSALFFFGYALNLFSLLALVLVLGIGINYTLFFGNPRGTPLTSMLAVSLAFITTMLTLGMLVFSSTRAISGFGIVLSCGIAAAFLLSPLAMKAQEQRT